MTEAVYGSPSTPTPHGHKCWERVGCQPVGPPEVDPGVARKRREVGNRPEIPSEMGAPKSAWHCTGTLLVLRWGRTGIFVVLHWYCIDPPLLLHWYYTCTVLCWCYTGTRMMLDRCSAGRGTSYSRSTSFGLVCYGHTANAMPAQHNATPIQRRCNAKICRNSRPERPEKRRATSERYPRS